MSNHLGDEHRDLHWPLISLLGSGGDSRLHVDPKSLLNKYGCSPFPRPRAFTFASSTASSISEAAFTKAASAHRELLDAAARSSYNHAADEQLQALRVELLALLNLADCAPEIVFSPSGTDSQLQAVFIVRTLLRGPITNVIAASDQTGSGTPHAVVGRHFSDRTAQGIPVDKGAAIGALAQGNDFLEVAMRDETGCPRDAAELDARITHAVDSSIAAGRKVLLHVMDCSKLGAHCPSNAVIPALKRRHGAAVQVIVDACQARLSRARLRWYLSQGCIVALTGSKFFTGPPFCGALLVPPDASWAMKKVENIPAGLTDYTNRTDWPVAWTAMRRALPNRVNLGQLLRWVASLEEIRRYFAVPTAARKAALQDFSTAVPRLIAADRGLQLLPAAERAIDGVDDEEMAAPTIFPFFILAGEGPMSATDATTLYRMLNLDVAEWLPRSASAEDREIASQLCHIGQPVSVRNGAHDPCGAVRISAGARFVYLCAGAANGDPVAVRNRDNQFNQIRIVLRKIELLRTHATACTAAHNAQPA